MKKLIPKMLIAAFSVLAFLSTPLWFPSLQVLAAQESNPDPNPFPVSSGFYILDNGWTAGSLTQKVLAVPQVVSWTPGEEKADWIVEIGFPHGGILDNSSRTIYITEQRNQKVESLLDVTFGGDALYANNGEWGMFLTTLDAKNGDVHNRVALVIPGLDNSGASIHPIGINESTLFLMNYAAGKNLYAYDLNKEQLTDQSWVLCESGYLVKAEFLSDPARVAALCLGHDNGAGAAITLTNLETDEQNSIELPILGKEEYQTGNGMFVANGSLYAIDSEVGVLVQIDVETMQILQTSNYRDSLAQQETSWVNTLLAWLGDQLVQPAYAKRFMSITAVSPDGRWLAVDGGAFADHGASNQILLIDLQTLQAAESFDLGKSPLQIEFITNESLLVLFDKPGRALATPGVLLDLASGDQQDIAVPTNGWIQSLLAAN